MIERPEMTIVVDHADGSQTRLGRDAPLTQDVPSDLTFTTGMPGGFRDLSCSLLRDIQTDGQERIFDRVKVLGPGGMVLWQGRLQQMARSSDNGGRIAPQAIGNQALLTDDPSFREIYIDRTLDNWGATPTDRKSDILNQPYKPFDGSTSVTDDGLGGYGPCVELNIPGYTWSSTQGRPFVEFWYDGRGIPIKRLEWTQQSTVLSGSDAHWHFETFSQRPTGDYAPDSASWSGNGPAYFAWTVPHPRPYVAAHLYYDTAPAGVTDATWYVRMSRLAVLGTHGLPRYAFPSDSYATGAQPYGLRDSDVIADVLTRAAPGVKFTTGTGGTLTPTPVDDPIGHLVFFDPTTAADAVAQVNARRLWHWAVWENDTFYWHPPGARGRTWRLAESDGLNLQLEGDDGSVIYNAITVAFTDFAGRQRIVGPPGTTGADFTDPRLYDSSLDNGATAHSLRRVDSLTLSYPTSAADAASIGAIKLAEQNRATRKGTAAWTGWVTDDNANVFPAAVVRGGDQLIVTDRPDDPPRRIVDTSYTYGTDTISMTLDNTATTVDAIVGRITNALIGLT